MYIISACLLGENCKYSGGNNRTDWVCEFAEKHRHIAVCPEAAGGLPIPRPPVEIIDGRAVNTQGEDVTEEFRKGSQKEWQRALAMSEELEEPIEGAVLKAKSPSCGSGQIYDGTFSHTLTEGYGFFAELLKNENIGIISEKEKIEEE